MAAVIEFLTDPNTVKFLTDPVLLFLLGLIVAIVILAVRLIRKGDIMPAREKLVITAAIVICAVSAGFILWLAIGFGGNAHPPVEHTPVLPVG